MKNNDTLWKIYKNEENMPITPNQFKRGSKIEVDGEPYAVIEWDRKSVV